MSKINNGTFSFNPEELTDIKQVIHELVWNNKELRAIHDVEEGVIFDKQIVFAGKVGLMGKAVNGCTPNEIEGVTLTQKFWTPIKEDFRLTHCQANVADQDRLVNQMSKINPDYFNIIEGSNNAIGNFLIAKVIEGFNENLLRKVWFSDKLADTVANSGTLTNGTDKEYFNTFDGLFKQLYTDIAVGSKNHFAIPKNDPSVGINYATQQLEVGDATAILKGLYRGADNRLKTLAGAQILVTQTIWDGYIDDLEATQSTGAGNTQITENGKMNLFYKGIPLVLMSVWDRNLEAYYDNGTIIDRPHRAVFTVPSNIPLATLSSSDFGTVNAFYDQVTRKNFVDGIYSLDAKHLQNYLTAIAS